MWSPALAYVKPHWSWVMMKYQQSTAHLMTCPRTRPQPTDSRPSQDHGFIFLIGGYVLITTVSSVALTKVSLSLVRSHQGWTVAPYRHPARPGSARTSRHQ